MRAANAEIASSNGYERWHYVAGRIAQPETAILAATMAASGRLTAAGILNPGAGRHVGHLLEPRSAVAHRELGVEQSAPPARDAR